MTFKEKLQMEHPEYVNERFGGGVKGCPYHYGYEKNLNCVVWESNAECEECWNREIPNTESTKYKQKLREKIIEEIKHAQERSNNVMCIGTDITGYLLEVLEGNLDYNAGYNKGLNDAWEFIKKWDNMDYERSCEVFKSTSLRRLLEYSPQEALAKLKAYEDSKIEVGDVVETIDPRYDHPEVVIRGCVIGMYDNNKAYVLEHNGDVEEWECKKLTKTDKHIDIKSILEQIGE